jgi:hypothetical protein
MRRGELGDACTLLQMCTLCNERCTLCSEVTPSESAYEGAMRTAILKMGEYKKKPWNKNERNSKAVRSRASFKESFAPFCGQGRSKSSRQSCLLKELGVIQKRPEEREERTTKERISLQEEGRSQENLGGGCLRKHCLISCLFYVSRSDHGPSCLSESHFGR